MTYWPWWLSGLALAAVAVGHWLIRNRLMAVSGRFTGLVNRIRFGKQQGLELEQDELIAAIRAATIAEFGEAAVEPEVPRESRARRIETQAPVGTANHLLFLGALIVGGMASKALDGQLSLRFDLTSEGLSRLTHESPVVLAIWLLVGGVLVGFGTRMAGGCTSGHGLCGVSRFQTGSLLATLAFFGTGVITAFALSFL